MDTPERPIYQTHQNHKSLIKDKMRNDKSFTLLELLIVIAVVAVLAGAMIPLFKTTTKDAEATKMVVLVETLRETIRIFYFDTTVYPVETSSSPLDCSDADTRDLSCDASAFHPGWQGPYIDHHLVDSDNPYGSIINLMGGLIYNYDLNGDGTDDKFTGNPGNELWIQAPIAADAKALDNVIDNGVPGDWMTKGRLRYNGGLGYIFIYMAGG